MTSSQSEPTFNGPTDHDAQDALVKASLKRIRNKILVMSGKGGVGKTSVSVNLAVALANRGFKTGLMDVDIHGPDVPRMLGLDEKVGGNADQKLVPLPYDHNLKVISIESLLPDKDDAIIWRGALKHNVIRKFIGETEWGDLDYLVIDSPPGTGDEPLSVAQSIPDARAIIVTTPQEVSLADIRKSINFCKVVDMEIAGLIENMSGLTCPHCNKPISLFGSGGGEKTAESYSLPLLGKIPFDLNMVLCGDAGIVFQERYANTEVSRAFKQVVETIISNRKDDEEADVGEKRIFAVPVEDDVLTDHFGHCSEFVLMYTEGKDIVRKESRTPPPHEPGVLPNWLHRLGTTNVIAGGMGNQAVKLLEENGIEVALGAPIEEPETLVAKYLKDTLVYGDNACDH